MSPSRMCSVPMYSWLKRCASWLASCITLRARSVKRSYMGALQNGDSRIGPGVVPIVLRRDPLQGKVPLVTDRHHVPLHIAVQVAEPDAIDENVLTVVIDRDVVVDLVQGPGDNLLV